MWLGHGPRRGVMVKLWHLHAQVLHPWAAQSHLWRLGSDWQAGRWTTRNGRRKSTTSQHSTTQNTRIVWALVTAVKTKTMHSYNTEKYNYELVLSSSLQHFTGDTTMHWLKYNGNMRVSHLSTCTIILYFLTGNITSKIPSGNLRNPSEILYSA